MGAQSQLESVRLLRHEGTLNEGRFIAARLIGAVGLGAYNWWIVAPFVPNMVRSSDGFFSDLAAQGQPHAAVLQRVDTAAGLLLAVALLLRGRSDGSTRRPEWAWLLAFAAVAAIGGMFPYACTAGYDAACRRLQYDLALPVHHYIHMASGVLEFVLGTMAVWVARHGDPDGTTPSGRLGHLLLPALILAYPFLMYAYVRDSGGTLVEPVFFLIFSALVAAELSGPGERGTEVANGDATAITDPAPPAGLGLP